MMYIHKYHVHVIRNITMRSKLHFHDDATDTRVSGTCVLLMNFAHSLFPHDVGIMNMHLVYKLEL